MFRANKELTMNINPNHGEVNLHNDKLILTEFMKLFTTFSGNPPMEDFVVTVTDNQLINMAYLSDISYADLKYILLKYSVDHSILVSPEYLCQYREIKFNGRLLRDVLQLTTLNKERITVDDVSKMIKLIEDEKRDKARKNLDAENNRPVITVYLAGDFSEAKVNGVLTNTPATTEKGCDSFEGLVYRQPVSSSDYSYIPIKNLSTEQLSFLMENLNLIDDDFSDCDCLVVDNDDGEWFPARRGLFNTETSFNDIFVLQE